MYERFYNLRERPFALSPDPEYLYLSRVHREALDSLRYGIESRAGFIVVTGEIGAGKTTLLQTLLQKLDERTVVARIVNTTLEPRELLEAIALDFGLEPTGKSKPVLLRELGMFLVQQRAQGRRPLLVIDEAQNLSPAALEEVRLLSNLETEKSKLLQILVVGQPNLRDKIASSELEQFRQRVAVSYHLTPLDAADTAAYINYRLDRAAIGEPPRFPPNAAELVHKRSGGVPRIINVICDAALVFGYAEERRHIDLPLVREVLGELDLSGVLPAPAASAPATSAPRASAPASTVVPATVSMPPAPVPLQSVGAAAAPAREPISRPAAAAATLSAPAAAAEQTAPPRPVESTTVVPLAVQEQALARATQEAAELSARLRDRERALAQRERELAEQRRILAEEYRMLRNQRAEAAVAHSRTPSGGGRRSDSAVSAALAQPRAEGLRGWLRRLFLGGSRRALQEN